MSELAIRVEFFGDEIDRITEFNPLTGAKQNVVKHVAIFPASHYIVSAEKKAAAKMTFSTGDTVDHKTFGRGKVTKVDGDTLFVKFSKTGQTKKLLKDYAPIVKIG